MLFPSSVFAIFFLAVFCGHWGLHAWPRTRKVFLLAASLFFYGYWSWKFALMLLGSALFNHAAACAIHRTPVTAAAARRRLLLAAALTLNLGLLAFFKYAGFLVDDVVLPLLRLLCIRIGPDAVNGLIRMQDQLYPTLSAIVLPVGISFFTFQALSYVMDVYRDRTAPARSWLDFANYLAFFPQLVAGPIVRAATLVPQMQDLPAPSMRIEAGRAAFLILIGLFKKIVVANWIATRLADPVFAWPEAYSGPDLLLGVYGYAVQIYCDFSAYSDIAIGTALLMGFHFPDNFNAPYTAATLQDFWRRWHISLSSWLRDYLYIPLGGSKRGDRRTAVNLLVTFLLGGLWHGAAWTFVLWGAFHGVYLLLERQVMGRRPLMGLTRTIPHLVRINIMRIWIFHVVCLSWLLFRGGNMSTVNAMLRGIGDWRRAVPEIVLWSPLAAAMVTAGLAVQLLDGQHIWQVLRRRPAWPAWALGGAAAAALTLVLALGPEGVAPFIYFQF